MYTTSQNISCGWMESQNPERRVASWQLNDQRKKRNLLLDAVPKAQASSFSIISVLTVLLGGRG